MKLFGNKKPDNEIRLADDETINLRIKTIEFLHGISKKGRTLLHDHYIHDQVASVEYYQECNPFVITKGEKIIEIHGYTDVEVLKNKDCFSYIMQIEITRN